MSKAMPGVAVFCVLAGTVLARFTAEAMPATHLVRPLVAAAVVAAVAGVLSALTSKWVAVAAVAVFVPSQWAMLAAVAGVTVWYAARVLGHGFDPSRGIYVAAPVMFLAGAVTAFPLLWFPPALGSAPPGPAQYLILLDGYPRADTLAQLGIDVGPFVAELESRGFDHYPDAQSLHSWTQRTLIAMTGTEVAGDGAPESGAESWRLSEQLALPDGWVTVPSPFGDSTFRAPTIGAGGMTVFDVNLLRRSVVGSLPWVGDWIIDSLRERVEGALETVAATDHTRVFAHVAAPHLPYLWALDGPAELPCWPCNIFWASAGEDWEPRLAATVEHLNGLLLDTIDTILVDRPDAAIVVFSDHGGRFHLDDQDEWHRSFLAARTPGRPGLFTDQPRPDRILTDLGST